MKDNGLRRLLPLALFAMITSSPASADGSQAVSPAPAVQPAQIGALPAQLAATAAHQLPAAAVKSLPVVALDGKKFDLAAVRGYKAIYFFSIFCPCVRSCEAISFKPLAAQYAGKVSFFAVTSGGWDLKDDRSNFVGLVETHHLTFPVVLDPMHFVADILDGRAASQVVVLGPDNHLLYSGMADDSRDYLDRTGLVGHTKSYLADALSDIFAGKPVALPWTQPKGCSIAK